MWLYKERDHESVALKADEAYTVSKNGNQVPKRSTKGWDLCLEWHDGSTEWVPLRTVMDSHPVEVASYAKAHKILEEPAFACWAKKTLYRRDRIISKLQKKRTKK